MNTPAHLAASVLIWRNEPGWKSAAAVVTGALTPDLAMFGFYAYQKAVGSSERDIWSELYFAEDWQLLFDLFNSIPITLMLLVVCFACRSRLGVLFCASALVHLFCDLTVHHDDAHRHFLPLTNWRLASPISYWDPKHYGHIFVWFELAFTFGSCLFVAQKGESLSMRVVTITTLMLYFTGIVFAVVMWSSGAFEGV